MKAYLMHRAKDFDLDAPIVPLAGALVQDLGLDVLLDAMAGGDEFLREVAKKALLQSLRSSEDILYRQEVLKDCLEKPEMVGEMYGLAVEAMERERHVWGWMTNRYPTEMLHRSADVLEIFADVLTRLRATADAHGADVRSDGFKRLFGALSAELSDEYLATISDHLERLAFRGGVLMSADLCAENKGTNYVLRKPPNAKTGWMDRFRDWMEQFTQGADDAYVYEVAERDEAGYRALSDLKSEGIASVATALTQSTDHILGFFRMLRLELGFYLSCLNLHRSLTEKGEPVCIPEVAKTEDGALSCNAMYDSCLSLSMVGRVVGNDVRGDGKTLVVITGANRGGKSTLLRSLGQAQLMMQCGMCVAAESYRASLCDALFTHFKREEDAGMKSGKLDEELARMSGIVDRMMPHSLLLLNESFASTNEQEGSEIARRIIDSILAMQCRVLCVTHMFDLAHGFCVEDRPDIMFLRAERLTDGERTFRLVEGEPLPTSYGEDLYRQVFGQEPAASIRAGG